MNSISRSTIAHLLNWPDYSEGQGHLSAAVMEQVLHTRGYHSLFGEMLFKNRPVHCVHIFICNYANFTPLRPKISELFKATTKVVQKNFPPTDW